jgi:hypothetical protein
MPQIFITEQRLPSMSREPYYWLILFIHIEQK